MRSLNSFRILALALGALLTWQAPAQEAAPQPDAQPPPRVAAVPDEGVEEVVVRGRRMSEIEDDLEIEVRQFVGQIATSPAGRGYARWHRNVCIGVHNLEQTAAQYIVDRISLLAAEVGLTPDEPGCDPGVIVIFTTDGQELASRLVETEPLLFRPGMGQCCMNLSLAALDRFAQSDRPVRWWHVSMPVDARTGKPAIVLSNNKSPDGRAYPLVNVAGPSAIHSGIRDDMRQVIIIVDSTKLSGTTWEELGDYLAVVSLVQIDLNANPAAFDSILNLFGNPTAYTGLTDWDRSYVHALYDFDQERTPRMQASDLVSKMVRRELDSRD